MPQDLTSKERSLFTQLVRHYENKHYKKGLKAAEQILKKHPNNGETQAMKALILNSQGQTDEAFALAKEGLKNDMKSHVCWHVFGLLYRGAKNFEESIKAFRYALKIAPESQQILRDLALLQIQMRDYAGYIQSRRTMLKQRPAWRQNWTGLAVAQHLSGDLELAEKTLSAYEGTLKNPPPKSDIEHHEAALYKNTIIAEIGETERALEHLEAIMKFTSDREGAMEMRAGYLQKLGRKNDAEKVYRSLIERNPDRRAYYNALIEILGIEGDIKGLEELYGSYVQRFPRADTPKRVPLDFLDGDAFKSSADGYLKSMLSKGVPSTFTNLKSLYVDRRKRDIIQELVESYASSDISPMSQQNGTMEKETSVTYSRFKDSVCYFLAQHYNYHRSRDLPKAMHYVEKSIETSPESVDAYLTKARILKHSGDLQEASKTMDYARSLDLRDRYICSKAAKYQLRNEENEAALSNMARFTRNEAVGGPLGDLHDMQCIWYLTEDAESYHRQSKLGLALKRYTTIFSIFETWQEDQFDFHRFSLQKGQIRSYIDLLKWEDHLRDHPYYVRAATGAIAVYIRLHENPSLANGIANGVNGSADPAEKKKAARKARKAAESKAQQEHEKNDAKKAAGGVSQEDGVRKPDPDPEGQQLLETKDPMKDAMKFVTPMLEISPKNIEAQSAAFEVFFRREKYLLALRCLMSMHHTDPLDPRTHYGMIRLQSKVSAASFSFPPKSAEVLREQFALLMPTNTNQDLSVINEAFIKQHSDDLHLLLGGLRARQYLNKDSTSKSTQLLKEFISREETTLQQTQDIVNLAREWEVDTSDMMSKASERWPQAKAFKA